MSSIFNSWTNRFARLELHFTSSPRVGFVVFRTRCVQGRSYPVVMFSGTPPSLRFVYFLFPCILTNRRKAKRNGNFQVIG